MVSCNKHFQIIVVINKAFIASLLGASYLNWSYFDNMVLSTIFFLYTIRIPMDNNWLLNENKEGKYTIFICSPRVTHWLHLPLKTCIYFLCVLNWWCLKASLSSVSHQCRCILNYKMTSGPEKCLCVLEIFIWCTNFFEHHICLFSMLRLLQ